MHVAIDLAIDDVGRDKIYIIIANCACGCVSVYIHVPCTDLWCAHVRLQLLAHNSRVHQRAQMCTQWLSLTQTLLHSALSSLSPILLQILSHRHAHSCSSVDTIVYCAHVTYVITVPCVTCSVCVCLLCDCVLCVRYMSISTKSW